MTQAKRLDALIAIGALIAPKAKRLAADVTQAFRDPEAYVAAHAARLNDRGVDEPCEDLPWIALIDGLEEAKRLAEIDWKTEAEDVEWNIATLVRGFRLRPIVDPDLDDRSTWEMLELAGIALRKKKLQLAQLDMGSDAFPLVVVPTSKFSLLARLAKAAKYDEAKAFGDHLAAARKERIAREKKDQRERAKKAKEPEPEWFVYRKGRQTWSIGEPGLAYLAGYEKPGVKRYEDHYFASKSVCVAATKRRVAEWKRDGFVKLTRAEAEALPQQGDGAYLHWTAPFPKRARYFLENNRRFVRCVTVRNDAVVETGGVVGRDFGELETHKHVRDAESEWAAAVARYESSPQMHKPIDRAALVALYKAKARAR